MLVYPGDPPFHMKRISRIDEEGLGCNVSLMELSTHCGTHLDVPYHFIPDGTRLHEIPASRWISRALVVSTGNANVVDTHHLDDIPLMDGMSILFHTRNDNALASSRSLDSPCTLTEGAAEALIKRKVNLVGLDWLSIEGDDDPAYPVHHALLSRGILILEGIQLHHIESGLYTLIVAPLHVMDSDGGPARAFLIPETSR